MSRLQRSSVISVFNKVRAKSQEDLSRKGAKAQRNQAQID